LIDAVNAGKDAYVEKPVTHSIAEGPAEISAVEQSGRIVQTGTQHRSWKHYIQGKQIIDSGALGEVRLVESFWFLNYKPALEMLRRTSIDVSQLDWKAWLGTAPDQPFSVAKFRFWRYFWDFGGGALTDLMTHAIDTVQWYMDSPTPVSAISTGRVFDFPWECPDTVSCTLEYPRGFLATYTGNHATGMDFGSIIFRGSKATLEVSRAALALYDEDIARPFATYDSDSRRWRPKPRLYVESDYEGTADNLQNWLDGIRSRKTPNANIRIGVESARAAHLGNAALRAGKRATWDDQQQRVII
jgi:predicted dehydrogenase